MFTVRRLVIAAALASASALAQPVGTEFRVNSYTTGIQQNLAVAGGLNGYLVVWDGLVTDGGAEVLGQRFTAAGLPLGAEFRVNVNTASTQKAPDVAAHSNTGFVVVYDNSFTTQFQRFLSSGAPAGTGDLTNTGFTFPAVAADVAGNFAAVWSGSDPDGSGVFARRVDSLNNLVGAEFRVNTYTTGTQGDADIAMNSAGDFLVVWQGNGTGDGVGIFAQRFLGATGAAAGPEFRVNTFTTGNQYEPEASARADGPFVVVWSKRSTGDISGQRFAANGAPQGVEFRVNSVTGDVRVNPTVAFDENGNFLVTWVSLGGVTELFGRQFGANGAPVGVDFRINTVTTGPQFEPHVASSSFGHFMVVWKSDAQTGSAYDIAGQLFNRSGDANGDAVVNVSDVLYLINNLYAGGPAPVGGFGNANGDGSTNASDVLYLINFLFAGGPAPI